MGTKWRALAVSTVIARRSAVAAIRASSAPRHTVALGDWRHDAVWQEVLWGKAVHRVVTEGISPEQAVDEAIARIKQILSE